MGKRIKGSGNTSLSPIDEEYWVQALEYNLCKVIPGSTLDSIDKTDIDTLFAFVEYINAKHAESEAGFVLINGKKYKKVAQFSNKF